MSRLLLKRHHLIVLHERYLDSVLAGEKRIECRLSTVRRTPFESVAPGDLLWLKLPSRPVYAIALAGTCLYRELRHTGDLEQLARQHAHLIRADRAFFDFAASWARFISLIWIETILTIRPMRVHKSDKRAWVVLENVPFPGMRIGTMHEGLKAPP